jgi:hypothetical protein
MNETILWIALGPYAALAAIILAGVIFLLALLAFGWLCDQAGSVIDSALRPNPSHRDH